MICKKKGTVGILGPIFFINRGFSTKIGGIIAIKLGHFHRRLEYLSHETALIWSTINQPIEAVTSGLFPLLFIRC